MRTHNDIDSFGKLGVPHLKAFWSRHRLDGRSAVLDSRSELERPEIDRPDLDRVVLDTLGVGLHQALQYLFREQPDFDQFEAWVVKVAGTPDPVRLSRLRRCLLGEPLPRQAVEWLTAIDNMSPVLTAQDLAHWEEHGFVILREAVSLADARAAEQLLWQQLGADQHDPATWYGRTDAGIMVELIQHPLLEANRRSARIHKAYAQLWGSADLWVSADRCGFHPPQTKQHPFPGPDLHWDIDFSRPLEFATQGILYLTDTPAEQGAFTLVPGFHHKLKNWLAALPEGSDPQRQDLHALGSRPVAANAGDMVIWHQFLPHGSRPNLGRRPRIVQYINMRTCPQ